MYRAASERTHLQGGTQRSSATSQQKLQCEAAFIPMPVGQGSSATSLDKGVMNLMAKARGLQLARNDKAAAFGCMTSARQRRTPAACAPSGAWVRNGGLNPSC